jgi:hypothetical protein
MKEAGHADASAPDRAARPAPARQERTLQTKALELQRAAGNRAASRVIARWIKHPDDKKKGVMMADEAADAYNHFNVPQNK